MDNIYIPQKLSEYLIHESKVKQIKGWIRDWENKKTNKYLIIYGLSGTGKTLLVNLILKEYEYDIVNYTPNYNLTQKQEIKRIESVLSSCNIKQMMGFKKKAILFEDIEIGSCNDRGYLNHILNILTNFNKDSNNNRNIAIFTINGSLKYKKINEIEKIANLIKLNRPSVYEIVKIVKNISLKMNYDFTDYKIQYIANQCQGDVRRIYHFFNIIGIDTLNNQETKKTIDTYLPNINNKDHVDISTNYSSIDDNMEDIDEDNLLSYGNILSKKDRIYTPLDSINVYCNPKNNTNYDIYQGIYDSDPVFGPANIFENSFSILDNIDYDNKQKYKDNYQILKSLCDWSILHNYNNDPSISFNKEYIVSLGIIKPLHIIRKARSQNNWNNISLKTSNLFSRISQSSFNWRSISELSSKLGVSRNEFHQISYMISNIIIHINGDLKKLGNFLIKKGINSTDLDRIIRYNCISEYLEKEIPNKRKSYLRKYINKKINK